MPDKLILEIIMIWLNYANCCFCYQEMLFSFISSELSKVLMIAKIIVLGLKLKAFCFIAIEVSIEIFDRKLSALTIIV
jgi:hypothetical protein